MRLRSIAYIGVLCCGALALGASPASAGTKPLDGADGEQGQPNIGSEAVPSHRKAPLAGQHYVTRRGDFWKGSFEGKTAGLLSRRSCEGGLWQRGESCGDPNAGDCCEANGTPGCSDVDCCETVCNICPDCGTGPWDGLCATLAIYRCGIGCTPIPDPNCPDNSLFCQRAVRPTDSGLKGLFTSDSGYSTTGAVNYERFWGLNEAIGGITWWGDTEDSDGDLCHENPMLFEIKFYSDDNGSPGAEQYSYVVTAEIVPAGRVFVWGIYRFEWSAQLDPPVQLNDGWVSIQGVAEPGYEDCMFKWWSSPDGDGYSCVEYDAGIECSEPGSSFALDLSFALTGVSTVTGDIDEDGDVDLSDLATLLATYGKCEGEDGYNAAADFDDNDCIELSDLAALLANYGYGG